MASQFARAWSIARGLIRSAADHALDQADSLAQSQADALWERAHDELGGYFDRLAALVATEFTLGSASGGGAGDDDNQPLHWWAEFLSSPSRPVTPVGQHADADVLSVISEAFIDGSASPKPEITIQADFVHTAGTLQYSSSVSADSRVLAEGPAGVIDAPHGAIGCDREIKTAVRDIGLFIEGSEHVIRDHLGARS